MKIQIWRRKNKEKEKYNLYIRYRLSQIKAKVESLLSYSINGGTFTIDINLITLLISGSQPGLQVKNKNGEWINIKSKKGQIVINTGDMLKECSDSYFPSTIHRVINPKESKNVSKFMEYT